MVIKVTQQHIDVGIPDNEKLCPIALAISEALQPEHSNLTANVMLYPYRLSRSAQRFINRFDAGQPVKPFCFRLDISLYEL